MLIGSIMGSCADQDNISGQLRRSLLAVSDARAHSAIVFQRMACSLLLEPLLVRDSLSVYVFSAAQSRA